MKKLLARTGWEARANFRKICKIFFCSPEGAISLRFRRGCCRSEEATWQLVRVDAGRRSIACCR